MKKLFFTALFALAALAVQAKTYKRIVAPNAMACVNVRYPGELRAREVVMTDTATTVHFTMEYPKGHTYQFVKESYLVDEAGNRYPLRSAEGIALNTWVTSPENGLTDFTMHFEPLPKRTKIFDFIEGDVPDAFMLLGIHDKKTKLKIPTLQQLTKANPYTVPADWFKTDTITIRGRFEGYDAERFGFTSMECYFEDIFEKNGGVWVLDIEPDGTFEKKFRTSYPIHDCFYSAESRNGFSEMPFFARPGETIDITVRKNANGNYECFYNNGSSKEVERWLKSNLLTGYFTNPLALYKGKFSEALDIAEKSWQNLMWRIDAVSRREHFTPMEVHLALAEAQVSLANAMMDFAMDKEWSVCKQENGEYFLDEIEDSAEWRALMDAKSYLPLKRVDFDNPMLLVSDRYSITLNRIQYANIVHKQKYKGLLIENDQHIIYENTPENELKKLNNSLAALRDIMATDKNNLIAQFCIYKEMLNMYNEWRRSEDYSPLSNYFAVFTHPYIRQKAEQYHAQKMAQKELSTPLPENNPAADLIRSLCAKYPGRFVVIDFWGMGCGPCRSAIQSSKQKRAEIAKRDDVKLVFIAEERTAGGSEAYHKYVKEWLADEEAFCVTKADFTRLQELFQFSAIPHYETITPDCRRVRDDLQVHGFYNINHGIEQLMEELKE